MNDTEAAFPIHHRIRWWWQRRRRAYLRPVYSNGQVPHPACEHRWRTEDRTPSSLARAFMGRAALQHNHWYVNVICTRCRAVRCGSSTDPNPCMEHRHHRGPHVHQDGTKVRLGG